MGLVGCTGLASMGFQQTALADCLGQDCLKSRLIPRLSFALLTSTFNPHLQDGMLSEGGGDQLASVLVQGLSQQESVAAQT